MNATLHMHMQIVTDFFRREVVHMHIHMLWHLFLLSVPHTHLCDWSLCMQYPTDTIERGAISNARAKA